MHMICNQAQSYSLAYPTPSSFKDLYYIENVCDLYVTGL